MCLLFSKDVLFQTTLLVPRPRPPQPNCTHNFSISKRQMCLLNESISAPFHTNSRFTLQSWNVEKQLNFSHSSPQSHFLIFNSWLFSLTSLWAIYISSASLIITPERKWENNLVFFMSLNTLPYILLINSLVLVFMLILWKCSHKFFLPVPSLFNTHMHTHILPQRHSNGSFSHYSLPSFSLIISQTPWIAPARLSAALGFLSTLGGCLKHLLAGCFPPVITLGRTGGMRDPVYHHIGSYHLRILNRIISGLQRRGQIILSEIEIWDPCWSKSLK